jgi:hypothetical protein
MTYYQRWHVGMRAQCHIWHACAHLQEPALSECTNKHPIKRLAQKFRRKSERCARSNTQRLHDLLANGGMWAWRVQCHSWHTCAHNHKPALSECTNKNPIRRLAQKSRRKSERCTRSNMHRLHAPAWRGALPHFQHTKNGRPAFVSCCFHFILDLKVRMYVVLSCINAFGSMGTAGHHGQRCAEKACTTESNGTLPLTKMMSFLGTWSNQSPNALKWSAHHYL